MSENNIDLSLINEDINVYEILIGGFKNTRSLIREVKQGGAKCNASTPGILQAGMAQPFWVSWVDGNIRLGREHQVGNDVICEWQDPTPKSINYVSTSTSSQSDGEWIFPDEGVKFLIFIFYCYNKFIFHQQC